MSATLEKYVIKIINQIDGTKDEKTDIYEELLIHLHLATEDGMEKGLNREEAEKMAMKQFGKAKKIGSEVQEAMYPLRKVFLLVLAITSLLYAYAIYIITLFNEGDAHSIWLLLAVGTSTLFLLIALQAFPSIDRKSILNATFIVHILIFLIGALYPSVISIFAWLIIIFTIILIYRTTIIDYQYRDVKNRRFIKFFHYYNISIGVFISACTIFYLWVFLVFAEAVERWMFIVVTPLILWIFAYWLQLTFIQKSRPKIAICIAIIPFLIIVGIIGLYIKISY